MKNFNLLAVLRPIIRLACLVVLSLVNIFMILIYTAILGLGILRAPGRIAFPSTIAILFAGVAVFYTAYAFGRMMKSESRVLRVPSILFFMVSLMLTSTAILGFIAGSPGLLYGCGIFLYLVLINPAPFVSSLCGLLTGFFMKTSGALSNKSVAAAFAASVLSLALMPFCYA